PLKERGKVLGINVAAVYSGLFLGPVIGGVLTDHFGWRSIFLAPVPLGFIIIFLVFIKLKGEWAESKGEGFDFTGSMIYCLAILLIMYGFSLLPMNSGILMVLFGVIGIWVFIKWEMKLEYPVFAINVFRKNIPFIFSNLAAFINYSATFATSFILSLYLQYIKGLRPQDAGLILISQSIVMAVFSPFAGRLSDKIEPRIIASLGMGLTSFGLFLFSFIYEKTWLEFIIAILILQGFGFALFSSPNTNAVMSSVEKKFFGVASGTIATMRLTGMMFSMGIAMLVFALSIGRVEITPPYYSHFLRSIKVIFGIFSILCFSGIFASLVKGKYK
ncbi:MAG: MFS transporter, partial [Deltaproteobacteria bacterium]